MLAGAHPADQNPVWTLLKRATGRVCDFVLHDVRKIKTTNKQKKSFQALAQ
jgi:hypothetical protein